VKVQDCLNHLNAEGNKLETLSKLKELEGTTAKTLSKVFKHYEIAYNNSTKVWEYVGTDENIKEREIHELEFEWEEYKRNNRQPRTKKNVEEPKNTNVAKVNPFDIPMGPAKEHSTTVEELKRTNAFSKGEIDILKQLIKERAVGLIPVGGTSEKSLYDSVIEHVPVGVATNRSSFNLTPATISRLDDLAKVSRIQKQDIVELAILQLLDRYEK
jgi:hypothetical protein